MNSKWNDEQRNKLWDTLPDLDVRDILIIYLRSIMGMTLQETADRVGLSHEGVRKRLKKIYDKMGVNYDGLSE